ncbi:OprD family outer membrane porin [Pseudomonas plecoglossicida]|uniref:OprD family outer membrane porin n=1 Tax=Pseudomonas plecoglossicida TaxID=70775 RepID=UPI003D229665
MKYFSLPITLVAVSLATTTSTASLKAQAAGTGFIEDSSLTLNTRQWYSQETGHKNTYFTAQTNEGPRKVRGRTAWLQGFKLDYVSGFTQGVVGVGLDVSTYSAVALERSKLATAGGSNRLLVDKDGNVVDDWSKVGVVAAKFQMAKTVVKVGRHQVKTPVMGYSDTRTLPASFDGLSLESHDIEGLAIKSGYFAQGTPRTGAGTQDLSPSYGSRLVTSDWVAYTGADYQASNGWRASAYASRFLDIWDREYVGLGKKFKWNELSTDIQFDFYNTQDSGSQKAGRIDQQAYGLSISPSYLNHTLKFGLQQIKGDEYFDYVAESNAVNLPNTMVSYYNGPNERSFQVQYINDLAAYGLPGLKAQLWYIKGWGVDGSHYDGGPSGIYGSVLKQTDESHYEVGSFLSYAIQTRSFKGAYLSSGYVWHRASEQQIEGNFGEFRLIVGVPVKIF